MSKDFFDRLAAYYKQVASVLRGEASSASIFPNSTDVGSSRERIYAYFLRGHAPAKCNVFFGGFLFNSKGRESKQLDVIVGADSVARFDLHNQDRSGKSFAHVEGALAVASIKSKLDKKELFDALRGLESIPNLESPLIASTMLSIPDHADWPYKIIYASDGIAVETLLGHLRDFYLENSDISLDRRPNLIHIAGKYAITRIRNGDTVRVDSSPSAIAMPVGYFYPITKDSDLQALVLASHELQKKANEATHIIFSHSTDFIENFYAHLSKP